MIFRNANDVCEDPFAGEGHTAFTKSPGKGKSDNCYVCVMFVLYLLGKIFQTGLFITQVNEIELVMKGFQKCF